MGVQCDQHLDTPIYGDVGVQCDLYPNVLTYADVGVQYDILQHREKSTELHEKDVKEFLVLKIYVGNQILWGELQRPF